MGDDNGSNSGYAYICRRDANGINWTQHDKLLARDAFPDNDQFGYSVDIYGDTAIIGAYRDDDNGRNSGSVYIFQRDTDGRWEQQVPQLLADDGTELDDFGFSVGIYRDTAIVGAHFDDDSGDESGSAYIFEPDANGNWKQKAKLTAEDGTAGDQFGYSVDIYNDTAIVGAPFDDNNGFNSGSAYIFQLDVNGDWVQKPKLLSSDGVANDHFGISVAMHGDTAIVGARGDDDRGSSSGSAYIFQRDANGNWAQQAKLIGADGTAQDNFGISVAIDGDNAVVGAHLDDDNGRSSGSAYIFQRDGDGNWVQFAKLFAADAAENDRFGYSVGIYDGTVIVGAYGDDTNGRNSGSAYIFA